MKKYTHCVIENDENLDLHIIVEPEAHYVPLKEYEKVIVYGDQPASPITIRVSNDHSGKVFLALWPGDGDMIVEKDGKNIFDLP